MRKMLCAPVALLLGASIISNCGDEAEDELSAARCLFADGGYQELCWDYKDVSEEDVNDLSNECSELSGTFRKGAGCTDVEGSPKCDYGDNKTGHYTGEGWTDSAAEGNCSNFDGTFTAGTSAGPITGGNQDIVNCHYSKGTSDDTCNEWVNLSGDASTVIKYECSDTSGTYTAGSACEGASGKSKCVYSDGKVKYYIGSYWVENGEASCSQAGGVFHAGS